MTDTLADALPREIDIAVRASATGDVIEMIASLKSLQEYSDDD